MHDPDYRVAVQDFNNFIGKLSERIIEIDETIPELPVKDIVSGILSYADPKLTASGVPNLSRYVFFYTWRTIFDTGRHSFLKGPYAIQGKSGHRNKAFASSLERSPPDSRARHCCPQLRESNGQL